MLIDKKDIEKLAVTLVELYGKKEADNQINIIKKWLLANPTTEVDFEEIIHRFENSEPIQYIIGEAHFYGYDFYVDKNTLIPRPETEELVYWVAEEWKNKHNFTILDIGTGSGCIAILLQLKLPQASIQAIDISSGALAIAQKNANRHQVNIDFREIDFLQETTWQQFPNFDIIVSNPPYIAQNEINTMAANVIAHEPHVALFVPYDNVLLFYNKIADFAVAKLTPDGAVYVEINQYQAENTVKLFQEKGFKIVDMQKDMQGNNRMIKATFSAKK